MMAALLRGSDIVFLMKGPVSARRGLFMRPRSCARMAALRDVIAIHMLVGHDDNGRLELVDQNVRLQERVIDLKQDRRRPLSLPTYVLERE